MSIYALGDHEPDIPPGHLALGVRARAKLVDPDKQQQRIEFAVREYVDNGHADANDLRLLSAASSTSQGGRP